eukprot:3644630-Rhodomonas_salina.1
MWSKGDGSRASEDKLVAGAGSGRDLLADKLGGVGHRRLLRDPREALVRDVVEQTLHARHDRLRAALMLASAFHAMAWMLCS